MNFRLFDRDTQVSEIGLGTWQLGGQWGKELDDARAMDILAAAVESGVTFLDTADVYGLGRSEELIGRFLRQSGAKLFVATKLGRMPPRWPEAYNVAGFREYVDASLRRLGVEALDLVQLHCVPREYLTSGEIFEWLGSLVAEGKIQRYGASVETIAEARDCLRDPNLASLQIIFNVLRQTAADELLGEAKRRGVAIIVRLPLASGVLSGRMTRQTTFDPADHRNFNRDGAQFNVGETFAGLEFEKAVELADAIKAYVPAGWTESQLALRWCLDHDAVTTVIPGASRPEQARANASASDLKPLSAETHAALQGFYRERVRPFVRGEI